MGKSYNNKSKSKGSKSKNNSKRKYMNGTDNVERMDSMGGSIDKLRSTDNDISWYVPNAQVLKDVASLPFNNVLGMPINVGLISPSNISSVNFTVPGIMRLDYISTWGASKNSTSALNVAARNIYTFIRAENSGAKNYEAPDLMMYFMAMDGLYSFIHEMKRAYGVAQYYLYTNRYLASTLLTALGWDPSILDNLADFRYFINQCILKFNQLNVPDVMPIFKRREFLASHVFLDAPSLKAQCYAFCCAGFNQLREGPSSEHGFTEIALHSYVDPKGSELYPYNVDNQLTARYRFEALWNPIISSHDFAIMSGDIIKAYGSEHCIRIDIVPTEYTVVPTYNSEVLPQIHNFRAMGSLMPTRTQEIAGEDYPVYSIVNQDPETGILTSNFQFLVPTAGGSGSMGERVPVDLRVSDPTPADVMIATRFTNCHYTITNAVRPDGFATANVSYCGTEIGTSMHIIQLNQGYHPSSGAFINFNFRNINNSVSIFSFDSLTPIGIDYDTFSGGTYDVTILQTSMQLNLIFMAAYANFDWSPLLSLVTWWSSGSVILGRQIGILSDLDNVTVIDGDTVGRMHDIAVLNELGVPYNGLHHV